MRYVSPLQSLVRARHGTLQTPPIFRIHIGTTQATATQGPLLAAKLSPPKLLVVVFWGGPEETRLKHADMSIPLQQNLAVQHKRIKMYKAHSFFEMSQHVVLS